MKHYFITSDGSLKARWTQAFPNAVALKPDSDMSDLNAGDVVWLTTMVSDWASRIAHFTGRGVIVVVLSYAADDREALEALDCGARGYAHTLSAPALLEQVALVVTNHGIWAGQSLLSRVLRGSGQALAQRSAPDAEIASPYFDRLTERERGVALAVARGASNKEIARELTISERTVKAHLGSIFKKLAVRDRLQLILKLSARAETHAS